MDSEDLKPAPAIVRRSTVQEGAAAHEAPGPLESAPRPTDFQSGYKGPLYTFRVPEKVRDAARDPATFTLRELTPDDHIQAARVAAQRERNPKVQGIIIGYESAKAALFRVDGRLVNHLEFEGDAYFGKWSSKVQALVMLAFSRVSQTTDEEDKDFLASMVVS
jgi:hypothetical protein